MARNHKNEGGGTDGVSPDAEIERLRAEQEARERTAREDAQRAERIRRDREGR